MYSESMLSPAPSEGDMGRERAKSLRVLRELKRLFVLSSKLCWVVFIASQAGGESLAPDPTLHSD